jgi:transposase
MTSPRPELPDDVQACHALIEQLRTELEATRDQVAKLQSAAANTQDARAQIAQLEALLARYQETIAEQEQAIENLAADNALLKRSLFGSRRERFTDDPTQTLLFETSPDSPPEEEHAPPAEEKKKRTSKGRQPRVFRVGGRWRWSTRPDNLRTGRCNG